MWRCILGFHYDIGSLPFNLHACQLCYRCRKWTIVGGGSVGKALAKLRENDVSTFILSSCWFSCACFLICLKQTWKIAIFEHWKEEQWNCLKVWVPAPGSAGPWLLLCMYHMDNSNSCKCQSRALKMSPVYETCRYCRPAPKMTPSFKCIYDSPFIKLTVRLCQRH